MVNLNNSSQQLKVCPDCKYSCNEPKAKVCQICDTPLINQDEARLLKNTHNASLKAKRISKSPLSSILKRNALNWRKSVLSLTNTKNVNSNLRELQKPLNLLGLFVLAIGVMLWFNALYLSNTKQVQVVQPPNIISTGKVKTLPTPQGLFSYGGAPIFAPLVASGINGQIENKYPGYELRYTKPLNQDYSSYNGIKMLLDGELSIAFNERPVTEAEYKAASLRNIKIKQIPIALDGVVVYGNNQTKIKQLNREQLLQIYFGEITNWHDIDPKIADLPIVPVVVQNEDLQLLGITNRNQQLAETAQYTTNYTQALRKVIGTPGSISFASASIVQNQQLVTMFALADGGSTDYVKPRIEGKLNIADFKTGKYPLTRRIFVVLRQDGSLDEKAGSLYAEELSSAEGQSKIEQTGLVPIINYSKKNGSP
jgi:phosphate transport system substrate-binding protein